MSDQKFFLIPGHMRWTRPPKIGLNLSSTLELWNKYIIIYFRLLSRFLKLHFHCECFWEAKIAIYLGLICFTTSYKVKVMDDPSYLFNLLLYLEKKILLHYRSQGASCWISPVSGVTILIDLTDTRDNNKSQITFLLTKLKKN